MAGTVQKQNVFVYNRGRLETEILQDNSMIQYTYDSNGNLLKRTKESSLAPYIISTAAVSYDIYLKGVPNNAQSVHFPTWREQNGQDDIEWIVGEKVASGVWKGTVVLSRHGGTGSYITHIYVDSKAVSGLSAQIQDTVKVTAPSSVSLADTFYEVNVEGVARTVSEVRFPSWTQNNGQDDLVNPWIMGEKINDTTWKIRIPFAEHNFETGNYFTHIYSFDRYGALNGIGGTTVQVKGGAGGSKETDISGVSYDVFIYGVEPTVQKVQFPTWTAYRDQDDIEWIDGVRIGNGVWRATVVYSKHNSEIGPYITHIYGDGNFMGAWTFKVTNSQNVKAPGTAKISDRYYEVSIEGVPANVTRLEFPTWTNNKGQDDLNWYQGERESTSKWKVRIPFANHGNETGIYTTHLYASDGYGNSLMVSGVTVEVQQ
ncbi:hypothetical protein GC101_12890 [Paenibacillus sp. LMG 31459]|uniref:Uncharacterized protein n=2 Tax=Paenibacillus phytohabitans TaxID=2654978 RepID=A0ABX1YFI9_9BACL|nr:hypothetical protein [Paenibacillus phytohabitans]